MRFYPGAHEYLFKVAQTIHEIEEKCLYLVPEVSNTHDIHAVMLHNGKQKLGNVAANEAPAIKKILSAWAKEQGSEDVVVCAIDVPGYNATLDSYKYNNNVTVRGKFRVNERLARKFSDKYRKV